ncbi:DUF488 domain-containing protein [Candidatus Odyssella acanthamoebae]|uniref:Uroporphyrin-III methyltransferase n=1 Tax=Candidatus Odyssella acanthamoebae TaxID=91604 RepID=A0A077AX29_9PROT|nr:DUF488 family protein [Candidatus Paracaedibacter acanthamoebae]AIK96178.1 uroporphyrin-III methyltransferase [Candidatus Paracaedibacter acanthamoebae]
MSQLRIKRLYQAVESEDGLRVLVDGLWPRGMSKEQAHIDLWLKEVAPSSFLRKWFNHDPQKWTEFCHRYHQELNVKKDSLQPIIDSLKVKNVTLLYGAKEERFNNAAALRDYIQCFIGSLAG